MVSSYVDFEEFEVFHSLDSSSGNANGSMVGASFPKVNDQLFSFVIVEEQVVHQQLHLLLRVCCFIIVDQADKSSVICIFNDGVMPGDTGHG